MMRIDLKTIAAISAVGAAMSMTGVAQANNNSLLFPFVTTSSTAYTFVTILENPYPEEGPSWYPVEPRDIGYHVWFRGKEVNASPTEQCNFWDASGSMKEGGLIRWEVGGRFDLPSKSGDENGVGLPFLPHNYQGFMIVEYDRPGFPSGRLHGTAQIIDTATGLGMSYLADNKTGDQPNFGEDAGSEFVTSWMSDEHVTTSWYVLPLGTRQEMMKMFDSINAKVLPRGNVHNNGFFFGDGGYISGGNIQNLTCFGIFGIDDLFSHAHQHGGWTTLKTLKPHSASHSIAPEDAQPAQIWQATQSNLFGAPVSSMGVIEAIH